MQQSVPNMATDEPQGPYLRVLKGDEAKPVATKQLPIQERINGMDLPAGARDVLVAICTMSEFGKDGCQWANNKGVGSQAGCHEKSVPRYLKLLQEQGLVEVTWRGLRREIRPTEKARSFYLGAPISLPRNQRLPRNSNQRLRGNSNQRLPQGKPTVTHNLDLELKEKEEYSLQVEGLRQKLTDLTAELQAAYAACSQRTDEVLALKEEVKAINGKWEKGKDKGRELYDANQQTIAAQAAEIIALKAELATPKTTALARVTKPVASLTPSDYHLPHWATDQFVAGFAEWLAFRQKHRAGKLQAASIQKLLDEMEGYDEGFCGFLFEKAIKGGYQGLTFNDTPATYETYKANQSTPFNPLNNPNGKSEQQQSARAQQLGLIDHTKRHAATAMLKELGLR